MNPLEENQRKREFRWLLWLKNLVEGKDNEAFETSIYLLLFMSSELRPGETKTHFVSGLLQQSQRYKSKYCISILFVYLRLNFGRGATINDFTYKYKYAHSSLPCPLGVSLESGMPKS